MELTPSAYVCPMHPHVRRLGPGVCTKCGLELVAQAPRLRLIQSLSSHPLWVALALLWLLAIMAVAVWLSR
jgi:Cu+-exporting ATPase